MNAPTGIGGGDYRHMLTRWLSSARKDLHVPTARPDLLCYGTGYDNWGVQTHQKAFATFATLAMDPKWDEHLAETSRDELIDTATRMLRFSLESHRSGSFQCLDGKQWGNTWISALGIERMAHGVEALWEQLTDSDRRLLHDVLTSECDWLVDEYEIVADPRAKTGRNKPESNLWNGAILLRTALMFPDHERATVYRQRGTEYLLNSISIPADAESLDLFNGKPLRDWHVGANFFPSYALNHHGYLNVGYMTICLSNVAMLHFSYRNRGLPSPPELLHHVFDLWKLVKKLTFPDGRLCRIGGDTRVRYCYCQDYAIPVWLLMLDQFGETSCLPLERKWLDTVAKEQKDNGDGSFLGHRLTPLRNLSPLYYTRLESDRAVTLSMALRWRERFNEFQNVKPANDQAPETGSWSDDHHGACFVRSGKRIASCVWEAAEKPQILALPPRSDLAEWRHNLVGTVTGLGNRHETNIISRVTKTFAGGFLSIGKFDTIALAYLESHADHSLARHDLACVALPDDQTTVILQRATTLERSYFKEAQGLGFALPNDIHNDNRRHIDTDQDDIVLERDSAKDEILDLESKWLNVDDALGIIGVYGADSLTIKRNQTRTIGIKNFPIAPGSLHVEEICFPYNSGPLDLPGRTSIFDVGFVVLATIDRKRTQTLAAAARFAPLPHDQSQPDQRGVLATGADGKRYLIIANFGDQTMNSTLHIPKAAKMISLINDTVTPITSDGVANVTIQTGEADVFVCD